MNNNSAISSLLGITANNLQNLTVIYTGITNFSSYKFPNLAILRLSNNSLKYFSDNNM